MFVVSAKAPTIRTNRVTLQLVFSRDVVGSKQIIQTYLICITLVIKLLGGRHALTIAAYGCGLSLPLNSMIKLIMKS